MVRTACISSGSRPHLTARRRQQVGSRLAVPDRDDGVVLVRERRQAGQEHTRCGDRARGDDPLRPSGRSRWVAGARPAVPRGRRRRHAHRPTPTASEPPARRTVPRRPERVAQVLEIRDPQQGPSTSQSLSLKDVSGLGQPVVGTDVQAELRRDRCAVSCARSSGDETIRTMSRSATVSAIRFAMATPRSDRWKPGRRP